MILASRIGRACPDAATVRRDGKIIRKKYCIDNSTRVSCAPFAPRDDSIEPTDAMNHSFSIAKQLALRPSARGLAACALAYRGEPMDSIPIID